MNIGIRNCCRIIFKSNLKPVHELIPRCFTSQYDPVSGLNKDKLKTKKDGAHILTANEAQKFKNFLKYKDDNEREVHNVADDEGVPTGSKLAPLLKIGTRVRRGSHWEWQAQDHNGVGEIIAELNNYGWVRVKWDNGNANSYRMGKDQKYDLQLAPAGSSSPDPKQKSKFYADVIPDVINDQCDSNILDALLAVYYDGIFPYNQFYSWLNYKNGSPNCFSNREIGFSMPSGKFYRYKSFDDVSDMEYQIRTKCPHKIHLGPVFSDKPKFKKAIKITPVERELIFDIDINEYDTIRTCCSKNHMCDKCWKFLVVGIHILERALRDEFGFKHILWVFSGRRGVHCWVCDAHARSLDKHQRMQLVSQLSINKPIPSRKREVEPDISATHIERSADIALSYCEDVILGQDLLGDDDSCGRCLDSLYDEAFVTHLTRALRRQKTTLQRWNSICELLKDEILVNSKYPEGINYLKKFALDLLFPRLDVNVSIPMTHMLKSPFSIHPTTGRVCVPFAAADAASFRPLHSAPTVSQLQNEVYAYDLANKGNKVPAYMKTSLKESIKIFENFISSMNE